MHAFIKRYSPSSFTPFLVAWVLSYLIVSTGFQAPDVANNAEVTSQSPLAKFVHSTQSYSLRFSTTKLTGDKGEKPTDAESPGLISASLNFAFYKASFTKVPSAGPFFNRKTWVKTSPRGPPSILS
ncbi:hypothetical protein FJN13_03250 [Alteromonas mediterranea]|uniref:hypothetical protein n=1 Tax=Alteromonas mediterranea TaxID=314275 RepID=UPI001131B453|nr:hypothetical protein [Alteromonas mediterranea]QDG33875.1 hypothetical protein FJN13_03250 [Alteromonas mediterranea]